MFMQQNSLNPPPIPTKKYFLIQTDQLILSFLEQS